MARISLRALARFVFILLAIALPAAALAQGPSRITGRVTDAATGRPLTGVRVTVIGTQLVAGTNADGRFTILGVQPGAAEVRAQILGFAATKRDVTVPAGGQAVADFALQETATTLDAVVTTATGEQRKLEVGNHVATIDAASVVETKSISSMSDLLVAKAAGVQVLGGNLTGAGQRIRIRGTNSLSLNNEPIFFIDGVRMTSDNNSASIGIGGTNPSRLNDINPDDIESIEVVKGPAASTLYGTDAANGVIVIKTKRGAAGPARWNVYYETGRVEDRNDYPNAYRGWRTGTTTSTTSTPTNAAQCLLADRARGTCMQDSVTSFNVFKDPRTTALLGGDRRQAGVNVGGGTDVARYFVGTEFEQETGVLGVPELSRRKFMERVGYDLAPSQVRPNAYQRANLRANLNFAPNSRSDFAVSTLFVQSDQRMPQTDNNLTGFLSNATSGAGNFDTLRLGYRQFLPHDSFAHRVQQKVNRYVGGVSANYRPLTWLSGRSTVGVDYTGRNEQSLCRRNECGLGEATNLLNRGVGFAGNNRTEFFQYTADLGANATWRIRDDLEARTAVGAQYVGRRFERNGAFGSDLPPGGTLAGQGAIPSVSQLQNESRTLGMYIDETLAWRDRLFLNFAVRRDENSAFGADFGALNLPKVSLSYIVSDESWFPQTGWVSSLRVRAARGEAATQPGVTDALPFFEDVTVAESGGDVPGLVFDALGNRNLRPERVRELELGVDAGLLNNRLSVELTTYDRLSRDALLRRILPPSTGGPVSRLENIGQVSNRGYEVLVNAQLLDREAIGWNLTLNGSQNKNKVVTLGDIEPIIGPTMRQVPGFPINGYWQRRITGFADANGDGIIGGNEVEVDPEFSFIGSSVPIREFSVQNSVDLFSGRLRLSALFDHKGGHYLLNGTERIRCESRLNCRGAVDPSAPHWEQARAIAVRAHPSRTQAGFMEKADFWRFREFSATLGVPQRLLGYLPGARSGNVVLAARNLAVWTDYTGFDPEANYFFGATGSASDFQTAPPPSYFTLRFNFGF